MGVVLQAIEKYARQVPDSIAVEGDYASLSYVALLQEVESLRDHFKEKGVSSLALIMDNGPAWVVVDLAAQAAGITMIPIPGFFSKEQRQHTLSDAGVEAVITDHSLSIDVKIKASSMIEIAGQSVDLIFLSDAVDKVKGLNVAKITYTSGTTGAPKGVCLSLPAMDTVAASLCRAIRVNQNDRHLCLLPLAVLLENVGGVYAPLLGGACCIVPSLNNVGVEGAAKLDPKLMIEAIVKAKATTVIMLPQMLQAIVFMIQQGMSMQSELRFIAVGGAPVSARLLDEAKNLDLPVYQGYGLSECSSVVAVNTAENNRPGSVGKVLPHMQLRFSDEGEILLKGNLFYGYLNYKLQDVEWYASGDLGYMDDEGYLFITGRKKNCFITSFGRNVAPEWVEKEILHHPGIAQAAVFGEARPFNVAVIVPREDTAQIEVAIEQANKQLPDYAQVSGWVVADEPFGLANRQYTATGRPRREEIWAVYGERVNQLYEAGINFSGRSQYAIL